MATNITNYTTCDQEYDYADLRRLPRLTDEEQARFNDGAFKGHILYRQCYQGKMRRPRELCDFLMTTLLNATHPSARITGFIAEWSTALHQGESRFSLLALARDVPLLLQRLQIHLHTAQGGG